MRKNSLIGGIVLAAALLLGGCGGADAPAGHNADDVTFAQQMVPHHIQALDMAKLVPARSANPKVLGLASRIEQAQDPEIRLLQGWLTTWGAAPAHESMPGMGGSMSGADLKQLETATGAEFDKMWLGMMIQHHQGAIEMARTELAQGADAGAKALAQKIIDAQQAEIAEMQGLLTQS
ncbi:MULTISPECIES: DUF305 domain-containing protein [unclassified Amycolatopsis]|uniref:DUF305 domain-containing protein n=1 Tax=unclassified Amycolatopsis TaxID=2618356 RepID=UPI0028747A6F|nr:MULTISPECIES: DUF305 domain-containing protein [unclassified Amycolatopsis]MDS0136145.1 DUF305 domain-containing protein [Amycolatopsis sp. 505]MDS0145266.1 DUF305 domain-containing protein [Amycolatopsis sp. CM201R]